MTKLKEMLLNLHDFVDEIRDEGYEELANDMSYYIDETIKEYDNSNPIKQIEQWHKERLLDEQEYDPFNALTNDIEEILEGLGYKVPKEKRSELRVLIEPMIATLVSQLKLTYEKPNTEDIIDSCCDKIVFNIQNIEQLGYDPECCLNETIKEISTRTGSIIDGKFQKDTSEEAMSKWYVANYSKCKVNK